MSIPLDTSNSQSLPITRLLVQAAAALQRQSVLLAAGAAGADGTGDTAGTAAPSAAFSALIAASASNAAAAAAAGLPLPGIVPAPGSAAGGGAAGSGVPGGAGAPATAPDSARVTLSPQALLALPQGAPAQAAGPAAATAAATATPQTATPASSTAAPQSNSQAENAVPAAAPGTAQALGATAWPTAGVSKPWQALAQQLVQQLTGHTPLAQRVVAAQHWPAGMAQALEQGGEGEAELPPMATWLVGQGTVVTAEGVRNLSLSLRVPQAFMAAQQAAAGTGAGQGSNGLGTATLFSQAAGMATPGAPQAQASFMVPGQSLQSGVMALVLQGSGPQAARTSALLQLDVQPMLASAVGGAALSQVYGRDPQQLRPDPWQQMAIMEAHGKRVDGDGRHEAERNLCSTHTCPYAGRASCEQPFCVALRTVLPVGPLDAGPR